LKRSIIFIAVLILLATLGGGLGYFHFVVKPGMIKRFILQAPPPPASVAVAVGKIETWAPRLPAAVVLVFTILAVLPDQIGQDRIDALSIECTVKKLITNKAYPSEIIDIDYDPTLAIRGIVVDKEAGNVFKMDRHLLPLLDLLAAGKTRLRPILMTTFAAILTLLPLSFGLGAGAALSFARGIGEFGATIMFAGSFQGVTQTLSLAIYAQFDHDFDIALTISALLIVLSGMILFAVKLRPRWTRSESTSPFLFAPSGSS